MAASPTAPVNTRSTIEIRDLGLDITIGTPAPGQAAPHRH